MNKFFTAESTAIDPTPAALATFFGGMATTNQHPHYNTPRWHANLLEAERFMEAIRTGRQPIHRFSEAMSTSDFPLYFADSLNRQLYGAYEASMPTWSNYARSSVVNDFRKAKRFASTGIRGLLKTVPELDEHERRAPDELEYEIGVEVYAAGFAMSWQQMVNDDLGMFLRLPTDLSQSAIDTEEYVVTTMFADANGPHNTGTTPFYSNDHVNILPGNPPLDRESLQAAITLLNQRKDERGNPITIKGVELVVGPALQLQAEQIVNAREYRAVGANGDVTIISGNGIAGNFRVNVNKYIPSVVTDPARAATSWWIFANPGNTRPALEVAKLRGFEQPGLYEKVPDMRRIGGGEVPWSFNHNSAEKKVQHVFGAAQVDYRMTVASDGSGV